MRLFSSFSLSCLGICDAVFPFTVFPVRSTRDGSLRFCVFFLKRVIGISACVRRTSRWRRSGSGGRMAFSPCLPTSTGPCLRPPHLQASSATSSRTTHLVRHSPLPIQGWHGLLTFSTSLLCHLRATRLPGLPKRRLALLRCHDGLLPRHRLRGPQHHPLCDDRVPGECHREHINMVGLPARSTTQGRTGFANDWGLVPRRAHRSLSSKSIPVAARLG